MLKLRRHLLANATAIALAVGFVGVAAAQPPFTFDPNAINSSVGVTSVKGNGISMTSSILYNFASNMSSFSFQGDAVGNTIVMGNNTSESLGLASGYSLDIQVSGSGSLDASKSNSAQDYYDLTQANWVMYMDMKGNQTSSQAKASTGSSPVVSGLGNTVKMLPIASGTVQSVGNASFASVSLVSTGGFVFNGLRLTGVSLEDQSSFGICSAAGGSLPTTLKSVGNVTSAVGSSTCAGNENAFFAKPIPFYKIAFDSWDSNQTNLSKSSKFPTDLAVNGITGHFNFISTPEPASLGLFGAALFGFGWVKRRRANKA